MPIDVRHLIFFESKVNYLSRHINHFISFSMSKEIKEYLRELEAKASSGDIESMDLLGMTLFHGQFVEQDRPRSFELFVKTAARGSAVGNFNLGVMYEQEFNVPKDINLAISHFKIACDKGYPTAFNNLAFLYLNGPESFRNIE